MKIANITKYALADAIIVGHWSLSSKKDGELIIINTEGHQQVSVTQAPNPQVFF